jgi:hypothetical protein
MTFIAAEQTNHNHRRTEEACRPTVLAQIRGNLQPSLSRQPSAKMSTKHHNTSQTFLGAFGKLRMSVRSSTWNSALTGRIFSKLDTIIFRKYAQIMQVLLKSDKNISR